MDKSNLIAIGLVLAVAGFGVGRWDAKPASGAGAAPVTVAAPPTATAEPPAAGPAAPAAAAAAAAPVAAAAAAAAPSEPAKPGLLDSQSDEGAGKGVELAKIAVSPSGIASPYLGPKDALVVVNVYSDFQCPVCKRSADPIKQLVADFPGKVKVYFRNNALAMHGRSKPAALAAWAAKNQGKFWQYHDKLFASGALDDASLEQHAKELGLDVAKWKADLADPKNSERLDQEAKWAESMGATGTPGFFVNGIRQVGWGSYMALKSMVQREVDKGEELAGQGTAKGQIAAKRIASQAAQNTKNEGEGAINGEQWASQLTAD
jgi:protein-disulfide isomerase